MNLNSPQIKYVCSTDTPSRVFSCIGTDADCGTNAPVAANLADGAASVGKYWKIYEAIGIDAKRITPTITCISDNRFNYQSAAGTKSSYNMKPWFYDGS